MKRSAGEEGEQEREGQVLGILIPRYERNRVWHVGKIKGRDSDNSAGESPKDGKRSRGEPWREIRPG